MINVQFLDNCAIFHPVFILFLWLSPCFPGGIRPVHGSPGHLATNSWGIPRFCSSARWSDVAPRGGSPVALQRQQMGRENDEFSWKNEEFIDNDEYMMIPYEDIYMYVCIYTYLYTCIYIYIYISKLYILYRLYTMYMMSI